MGSVVVKVVKVSYLQLFTVKGTYLYIKSKSLKMSRLSRHSKIFVRSDIDELTKALEKMKIEDDADCRTVFTDVFRKMPIIGCKRKGGKNDVYGVAKKKFSEEVKEFQKTKPKVKPEVKPEVQPEDDEKPVTGRKRRSNESDECGTNKKKISESAKKRNIVLKKWRDAVIFKRK